MIAIHADWPTYAIEHGKDYALERVGQFPIGTPFFGIDDIDQCILFRVGHRDPKKNDFDDCLFHIALWHEDILGLFSEGWVGGIDGSTPRDWAKNKCDELGKLLFENGRADLAQSLTPDIYTDTESILGLVWSTGMVLTESGRYALQDTMAVNRVGLVPAIASRVAPLIAIGAFDTAVREACLLLEVHLKAITGNALFGVRLVEAYITEMRKENKMFEAHSKWLRTELRACFSFVRNDFMHNIRVLTEPQCIALLYRVSSLYSHITDISADGDSE